MKMELNCLIFIKYQMRKYYSANLRMINATWDVFHMICAILKRMDDASNYNVQLPYSRGLRTERGKTRISISCTSSRNGSGKHKTLTYAPKFVQFVLAAALMERYLQMRKQTLLSITKRSSFCRRPKRLPGPVRLTFVVAMPSAFSIRYISPQLWITRIPM